MNIFGLNMAFGVNLGVTRVLGKRSEWAWRIPIVVMQVYPAALLAVIESLPESPRWLIYHGKDDDALAALHDIHRGGEDEGEGDRQYQELKERHDKEVNEPVSYWDMLTPSHIQFHPTIITIAVQVNQALTGYGAVSVYG